MKQIFQGLLLLGMTGLLTRGAILTPLPRTQAHPAQAGVLARREALAEVQAIVQLHNLSLPPPVVTGSPQATLAIAQEMLTPTIQAVIGNRQVPLLVDTGASTTLLSKALVTQLQLEGQTIASDRLTSAVAGRDCPSMEATLHQLPPLSLGGIQVDRLRGLAFAQTEIPQDWAGVLGMNFLQAFDLSINPQAQQLTLRPPSPLPRSQRAQAIPLQRQLNVLVGPVRINGQGPFTLLFDTGAEGTFISPAVAKAASLGEIPQEAVRVRGFCGLEPAVRLSIPSLDIGPHRLSTVQVIVLDSAVIKTLQVDGILGQNVLSQFEQHWRFPAHSLPDSQAQGSLLLTAPN
ncbi:retropepsin-like aspartic protease [Lyngbya confervoides]|uniref:Retroviral-like aspartic protease family protein n=1 Tax=Lyngbya confervoides BDU141951 TaxID=1574623 RepID=A0ABD4SZY3_9CYAN|nr:retropepsin-like aspartic protease [Lyngbya confervoides]MCM1982022.1 retroviral-like aspartic protease family protein [Lyngbya confervoides BDU141951]